MAEGLSGQERQEMGGQPGVASHQVHTQAHVGTDTLTHVRIRDKLTWGGHGVGGVQPGPKASSTETPSQMVIMDRRHEGPQGCHQTAETGDSTVKTRPEVTHSSMCTGP